MDAQEATAKFRQADDLFRQGFFVDALALLDELDHAYPNTRRILFPRAMCLYRLDRRQDALELCNELIKRFDYPRAKVLRDTIELQFAEEEKPTEPPEDTPTPSGIMPSDGDVPAFPTLNADDLPEAAARRFSRTGLLLMSGAALAALVLLALGALMLINRYL